ncbi:alpha/beta fold hydrolase [Desulfobacula toluolica]|uniref:Alpha/beta hydrolase fold protein n=1 Tax=Desulfobacula toluolica (strain DSM 7467 / Tol2) TaxID=651182 RepID=K0NMP9_DESTT|nr:alpha/beta hydrolase [Desulfobacula toluolica]CCK81308.1 alpha/beta hydrolase fold protein [Desulfobacula toluolica Tol2]
MEFLKIGSKKIEVQWHKQRQKDHPTLIFLHEGLGCAKMWKDFPQRVSQMTSCPCLVFSRFGYGNSDPCPVPWKINFMHKQALSILPAIIKKAQIKDYILIGHSDGASIGIIFAGSPYARGLKGLITEAAHLFCEPVTVECIQQAKTNYEQHDLKQRLEKYHGKNTKNAFRGWNDVWLNPNFINWNIEKYLKHINVPMLAIQGKDDQYGTVRHIHSIRRHVNHARTCLIDNCRHSPHLEQPEKALNIITEFISHIL